MCAQLATMSQYCYCSFSFLYSADIKIPPEVAGSQMPEKATKTRYASTHTGMHMLCTGVPVTPYAISFAVCRNRWYCRK